MNRGEAVPLAIARPNVEGTSDRVGGEIVDWIKQGNNASFIAGVQILDAAANILESSKVAPAAVSARVRACVRVCVCVDLSKVAPAAVRGKGVQLPLFFVKKDEKGRRENERRKHQRKRKLQMHRAEHTNMLNITIQWHFLGANFRSCAGTW